MISKKVRQYIYETLKNYYPPYNIFKQKPWHGNNVYLVLPKQRGLCLGYPPVFFEKDGVISCVNRASKEYKEWFYAQNGQFD